MHDTEATTITSFLVVKLLREVYSKTNRYDVVLHNGGEKIELF